MLDIFVMFGYYEGQRSTFPTLRLPKSLVFQPLFSSFSFCPEANIGLQDISSTSRSQAPKSVSCIEHFVFTQHARIHCLTESTGEPRFLDVHPVSHSGHNASNSATSWIVTQNVPIAYAIELQHVIFAVA